ncbi:hypothetical protein BJI49_13380 [Acetobacter pasteurianus]|uniref:hypothetical protein n=1 Tax=Acetobacter pasteurianus TaxID=438 RepID=UPI000553C45F|nr:hypothetical protein [Acetobacter pasteurianus]RCL04422.1 hypothetical protein BJI49_13380 [Acetobacter pasteurianus]GCD50342.1 hypothetical protein NBRC106471_1898 [Acetobacter pasteurianus subsp. pasteurianus LMG 1262 = NBRC 106471]
MFLSPKKIKVWNRNTTPQDWNAWISASAAVVQAIGSVAAIWTSIFIARKSERRAVISEMRSDLKQQIIVIEREISQKETEKVALIKIKMVTDHILQSIDRVDRTITGKEVELIKHDHIENLREQIKNYCSISKDEKKVEFLTSFNSGIPTLIGGANNQKNKGIEIYYSRLQRNFSTLRDNVSDFIADLEKTETILNSEHKLLERKIAEKF